MLKYRTVVFVCVGLLVGAALLSPLTAGAHGTSHVVSENADPAVHGDNSAAGSEACREQFFPRCAGLEGTSNAGPGVLGRGLPGISGIAPPSAAGAEGVRGWAQSGTGVLGLGGGTGVRGSGRSAGVEGSGPSVGVVGRGPTGLRGTSSGGFPGTQGAGVHAQGTGNALALRVSGPAQFSTAGQGTIERANRSRAVANNAVGNGSLVLVTLLGDPGNGVNVKWVERKPGEGFVVHLTRRAQRNVPFAYLILEAG